MSDFRSIVLAMAAERPDARVGTIVALALAVENAQPPNWDDATEFGRWALRQSEVKAALAGDLGPSVKIHAIKELRALTKCSLVQAKNALEAVAS